jgi:DNA-binding CsgD family transcriptional regulator
VQNGAERSAQGIETANAGKTQAYREREKQAQMLFADGKTAKEIAQIMNKQLRTVNGYLRSNARANGAGQGAAS